MLFIDDTAQRQLCNIWPWSIPWWSEFAHLATMNDSPCGLLVVWPRNLHISESSHISHNLRFSFCCLERNSWHLMTLTWCFLINAHCAQRGCISKRDHTLMGFMKYTVLSTKILPPHLAVPVSTCSPAISKFLLFWDIYVSESKLSLKF